MKQTQLYDTHLKWNARMVSFYGYVMPLQYDSIINEHHSVRKNAGLFDVSHMGRFAVSGDTSFPFIQQIITNNAGPLADKQVLYTPVCNEQGGIIDDILVYKWQEKHFVLVVNCANAEKDLTWLQKQEARGIDRKLVGFEMIDRGIPRHDYLVFKGNEMIGKVTSGSFSPSTNKNIGLCLIQSRYAKIGEELQIQIRDNSYKARIVKTPFYKA